MMVSFRLLTSAWFLLARIVLLSYILYIVLHLLFLAHPLNQQVDDTLRSPQET